MSEINGLPVGWVKLSLREVCEKAEAVKRKAVHPDSELFYLDIGAIDNSLNKILGHKIYKWKDAPSRAQQIVLQGDTLFSTVRTYLKNIAFIDNKIYDRQIASSGFTVIRGNKELADPKFLFYLSLSHSFLQPLNELQTGTSYPAVRDSDVFMQTIPLPPLPEQHRIVSKIEELFSSLDKGVESLKTARQQLKVYRQAVLKWAFDGRLTNENVVDGELPVGWYPKKVSDIAITIGGYAFKSTEFKESGRFQVLRMGNVRPGVLRYDESPVFMENIHESVLNKALLKTNDVIITQTGTKGKRDYGFTALIIKSNLLLN